MGPSAPQSGSIRSLVRETTLQPSRLIAPLFVKNGTGVREPIDTMPGQFRLSADQLREEADELMSAGVRAVNLFGYSESKAHRLMMEVHTKGRSIVWTGGREQAEVYVHKLQAHHLLASLEKVDA